MGRGVEAGVSSIDRLAPVVRPADPDRPTPALQEAMARGVGNVGCSLRQSGHSDDIRLVASSRAGDGDHSLKRAGDFLSVCFVILPAVTFGGAGTPVGVIVGGVLADVEFASGNKLERSS